MLASLVSGFVIGIAATVTIIHYFGLPCIKKKSSLDYPPPSAYQI